MKIGNIILLILFVHSYCFAQEVLITGNVSDAAGGLPGVSIRIESTGLGMTTDLNGDYQLSVNKGDVLTFSFIGFVSQQVLVGNQGVINVTLMEDIRELEEIVVVGYGSVRKSDLTGSITSIKNEELIKVPSSDVMQALQGKVAGLQVLSTSGEPGGGAYVRLRGINTLNDNSVLYVIDGVIGGSIGAVNSQDIESIEVLKDASSKAIFGTRGANGVIIVTTKQSKGDAKINFSSDYSIEKVANELDLMSGQEFASFINEAIPGTYNNINALPNVDWQDLVFEDWQPVQNHTLSIAGSSDKFKYYVSGGYFKQNGVIPKSDFKRTTFRFNSSYQAKEYLKIGANLSAATSVKSNLPDVLQSTYWAWPIDEPYNDQGEFTEVQGAGNPLAAIAYSNSETDNLEFLGNIYSELTFLKDFVFKTSYQFDLGNSKTRSFVPAYFVSPTQKNDNNDLNVSFGEKRRWIFENTLSFTRSFSNHNIAAVVGYSAQEDEFESLSGFREDLLGESEELWYLDAGSSENQQNGNSASHGSITSILFRTNYTYLDRYLFTLTFRRDGSSKFGTNNRYANFPAVAIGWNISDESFFPSKHSINQLKLRASWGVNGNQNINSNDQYSRIGAGIDAVFGESEAINAGASYTGQPGNPDLRWEKTTEYDIGLEFGLFDHRLSGEIDYYNRLTEDILVPLDLPGYAGAGPFVQKTFNAATVRNSGLEFVLNYRGEIGDFTYSIGANGSSIINEVESLGEGIPGAGNQLINGDLGNGQRITLTEVGNPIGYFYGYVVDGVFQNEDELAESPHLSQQNVGDFRYKDTNNDGELTPDDRTFIGSWIPDFVYGFNLSAGYKGFNLSLDFAGQSGNKIYNGKQTIHFSTLNHEDKFIETWTGTGTTDINPRASIGGINYSPSDYFLEDASFLKLRTVTLNYAFPASLINQIKLTAASLFVRGTNLWQLTKYSGYTPEIGGTNSALGGIIDLGVYPTTKVVSAGVNLSF